MPSRPRRRRLRPQARCDLPPPEPRGAEERPALRGLGQSPAAHCHALIALLTRQVERGGAVVVRGVHHCALGNQEVDEGRLPCRTEGKKGGFLKPVSEAMTLFHPLICWRETSQEAFFCVGGTRANVKSHAVDSGHSGGQCSPSGGSSAPAPAPANPLPQPQKEGGKSLRCPQKSPWCTTSQDGILCDQEKKILTYRNVFICCLAEKKHPTDIVSPQYHIFYIHTHSSVLTFQTVMDRNNL